MDVIDQDEVYKHKSIDDGWIIYENSVYDVTEFIQTHPGGINILKEHLGQDITNIFHDPNIHQHSQHALTILESYKIGVLDPEREQNNVFLQDDVDYSKSILKQLHKVQHRYQQWVYEPISGAVILFDSPILEFFSRCHWMTVPIFWLPIIVVFLYLYFCTFDPSIPLVVRLITITLHTILGVLNWTLIEYLLHRYLFHLDTTGKHFFFMLFHFTIHGLHHKAPMDRYRLVFPPAPAVALGLFLYLIYYVVFGTKIIYSLISGTVLGYVGYDMIHYYLHHGYETKIKYFQHLRRIHNSHHYDKHNLGFGISNSLWDWVLGTEIIFDKSD